MSQVNSIQQIILTIITDECGDRKSILQGLTTIFLFGSILGIALPHNPHLHGLLYPYISSIIGYTYCAAWSLSYYPQLFQNYRRKDTTGLSMDFCVLQLFGCLCYASLNTAMLWSQSIQDDYALRHPLNGGGGAVSMVEYNDVVFALHSVIMSILWIGQVGYYNGFRDEQYRPSKTTVTVLIFLTFLLLVYAVVIALHGRGEIKDSEILSRGVTWLNWLDFLYVMTDIKVAIIMASYIPQVILNFRNRVCGWNIWCVLLDFIGGILSILQLILDSWNMNDWSGIVGDRAKFGLGFVSIFFDIIFFMQHYLLFPTPISKEKNIQEEIPLVTR